MNRPPVTVYIGLGSNLDKPLEQIGKALQAHGRMADTTLEDVSPLYRSTAVGPVQPDFINAVARITTQLPPLALLDALQAIEQAQHRVRLEHWGPRTIDLDILLYGNQIIQQPRLQIPHPEIINRSFVLYPLADLDPFLCLPNGVSIASLLGSHRPDGLEPLFT